LADELRAAAQAPLIDQETAAILYSDMSKLRLQVAALRADFSRGFGELMHAIAEHRRKAADAYRTYAISREKSSLIQIPKQGEFRRPTLFMLSALAMVVAAAIIFLSWIIT
jgi:hypothetical protein